MNTTRYTGGFTIIELMITLFIAGILVAVAAPSFNRLLVDNRLTTEANLLLSSLQTARSEAAMRGVNVTLRIPDAAANQVWDQGWIMFTDWGANATPGANIDTGNCANEENCILQQKDAVTATGLTIRSNNYARWISFDPAGRPRSAALPNGTFTLCIGDQGRQVTVNITGRSRVQEAPNGTCP